MASATKKAPAKPRSKLAAAAATTKAPAAVREVPVGELIPDRANVRIRDDRAKATILASLKQFGPARSIVLDGKGIVRAGNGTLEQYAAAGGKDVLIVEPKPGQLVAVRRADWSAAEGTQYAIADNRSSELADWDRELASVLDALRTDSANLTAIGFDDGEIDKLLESLNDDAGNPAEDPGPQLDRAAELQAKWKTERGQIWEIGKHRLMCGDSRQLLQTIAHDSVAMIFTDPPYGHNNNNNDLIHRREAALGRLPSGAASPPGRPIANDGPEANELLQAVLPDLKRVLLPGGCCCCCCCGGGGPDPQFARWSLWIDAVIPFKMCVVWDKGGLGMGWHYRRCWECILVAEKPGSACKWYGGNDVPNIIRDIGKIIPSEDQHPTIKPVELPAWFIKLHSQSDELILDPFVGSGTTLVAAEQLGRRCYGLEIEPKYVAVTLERMSGMGLTPRLERPATPRRASSRRPAIANGTPAD
jgi:hypothetical protein